jgi:hypothetical protein
LLPFLAITFLPLQLRSYSCEQLESMGVQLEDMQPAPPGETLHGSDLMLSDRTVMYCHA